MPTRISQRIRGRRNQRRSAKATRTMINLTDSRCTDVLRGRRGPRVQGNRSLFSGNSRVGPRASAERIRGFGGNCGVVREAAGLGRDLGIDLVQGFVAVFEDVVLVVEFSEALGQRQQ